MKSTRSEVYAAIDAERAYQNRLWNEDTTLSGGSHTPTEWLVYIQDYLTEAVKFASREADPVSREKVLHNVRKIAGMAVACMEQNGVMLRASEGVTPEHADLYAKGK